MSTCGYRYALLRVGVFVTCRSAIIPLRPDRGEEHGELTAQSKPGARRPHGATVHFHEVSHHGEPDAAAAFGADRGRVRLGKHVEYAQQHGRLDAYPGVANDDAAALSEPLQGHATISPPSGVYLAALISRFENTCSRRAASASTHSGSAGKDHCR